MSTSTPAPWIVYCTKKLETGDSILRGPFTPKQVRRYGYRFTANPAEAWPFPDEAQAKNKACIVNKHIGWTKEGQNHMAVRRADEPQDIIPHQKMSTPQETRSRHGVTCPYCGHLDEDSYELGDGGEGCGETECGECGKPFAWVRSITVNYTGKPL